jgi:flagellar biogenesis protein FliO
MLTVGLALGMTLDESAARADEPTRPATPTVAMPSMPTAAMPAASPAPVNTAPAGTATPAATAAATAAPTARVWWTPPKGKTTHPATHASANAEEPAPAQAAPAPVAVAPVAPPAPVSAPAPAAAPPSTERPWLRAAGKPAQPTVKAPAPASSPWRALGVLVVLGGLGGAALVARKRRLSRPGLPESATRVRVLSSARIGPKANAVVAEVGGRVLLLGVTDTNVVRLAWLDRDAVRENPAVAVQPAAPRTRTLSTEPVETAEADLEPPPERSITSRFGEVLDRALGVKPARDEFRGNPGVAALLAAGVEDVVVARVERTQATQRLEKTQATQRLETPRRASRADTSPGNTKRGLGGPSPAEIIVEDQVAGLKRPRRRA